MKGKLLLTGILALGYFSVVFSQSLISEKQIPLSRDQQKNEMEFALRNDNTNGATVFFESTKADKVKGEKRKYQRYEMTLDQDLNLVSGDYKIIGTKNSVKPKLYFKDFRIGYTTWVDDETEDKIDKMVLQLIKFDNNNKVLDIKDIEICEEKGFRDYQLTSYNGDIVVMAQYEKKKTKDKKEKNRDYIVYKRIDASTLEVKNETELNLLGKDVLDLESYLIVNDKYSLLEGRFKSFN